MSPRNFIPKAKRTPKQQQEHEDWMAKNKKAFWDNEKARQENILMNEPVITTNIDAWKSLSFPNKPLVSGKIKKKKKKKTAKRRKRSSSSSRRRKKKRRRRTVK